jgi:integrase
VSYNRCQIGGERTSEYRKGANAIGKSMRDRSPSPGFRVKPGAALKGVDSPQGFDLPRVAGKHFVTYISSVGHRDQRTRNKRAGVRVRKVLVMASNLVLPTLPDLVARIKAEHEAVAMALWDSLQHALHAGDLLIEAKRQIEHGEWSDWLDKHCQVSQRSARAYMQLAKNRSEIEAAKRQSTADLSVNGALKLLANPKSQPIHWQQRVNPEVNYEAQRRGVTARTIIEELAKPKKIAAKISGHDVDVTKLSPKAQEAIATAQEISPTTKEAVLELAKRYGYDRLLNGFAPWSEDDIAVYERRWPIGTRQRVWLDVLIYTGLRRGDAVRFGRPHIRNGVGTIKTEKTGTEVTLPILPVLANTLEVGPCG